MTNPTAQITNSTSDEREQRLKQIRERSESRKRVAGKFQWAQVSTQEWSDIDFLLSLLDRDPRPFGNQHLAYCARHASGDYDATVPCSCYDAAVDAATSMRSLCVEKVKAHDLCLADGCELVSELQSLTLDQVEQKTK